jgi:hypothetical protein
LTEFDLRSLLGTLQQHDVSFVVIGGVAVGAHGFVRGTEDLDVVPDPDPDNLKRLTVALAALESTLPTAGGRPFDPSSDAGVIRRGGNVTATTRFGALDVVQLAEGVPSYSQLSEDAIESDMLGIPVRICSLSRLRQMKETQNRTKDQLDLENLPEE